MTSSGCIGLDNWTLQNAAVDFPYTSSLDMCVSQCQAQNMTQCAYSSSMSYMHGNNTAVLEPHCVGLYDKIRDTWDDAYCNVPCESDPNRMCGGQPVGNVLIFSLFDILPTIQNRPSSSPLRASLNASETLSTTHNTTTTSKTVATFHPSTTTTKTSSSAVAVQVLATSTSTVTPSLTPPASTNESTDSMSQMSIVAAALVGTALVLGIIGVTTRYVLKKRRVARDNASPVPPPRTVSSV